MLCDRTEFLGNRDGRKYKINTEDERRIEALHDNFLDGWTKEKALDDALDSMEDGYNTLEEIDGVMYEVYENNDFRITRVAYL